MKSPLLVKRNGLFYAQADLKQRLGQNQKAAI